VPHEEAPALGVGPRHRLARITLARGVDHRLDGDLVQLLTEGVLGSFGALECRHAPIIRPPSAACQDYVYDPREEIMRVEIICTGDEVLTGKIVNTNFSYMSQKLEDVGLAVAWETTVGDDRESLGRAFLLAAERADAVIVNGGLGPTVDDLSQEIAAQAAGVPLVLNEEWLVKMEDFFKKRSRTMPPNNRKQAMLPATAEILDNPIGTACGFALDIGKARFFFTPGVPRELRRMLEEQIIPRLLARSGEQTTIVLKRFHSYGLGESHVDSLLTGVEALVPDGSLKLASARTTRSSRPSSPCAAPTWPTCSGSSSRWSGRSASASATSSSPRTTRPWRASSSRRLRRRGHARPGRDFHAGSSPRVSRRKVGAEKVVTRGIVSRDHRPGAGRGGPGRPGRGDHARPRPRRGRHGRRLCGATHALACRGPRRRADRIRDSAAPSPRHRRRGRRRIAPQPHSRRPCEGCAARRHPSSAMDCLRRHSRACRWSSASTSRRREDAMKTLLEPAGWWRWNGSTHGSTRAATWSSRGTRWCTRAAPTRAPWICASPPAASGSPGFINTHVHTAGGGGDYLLLDMAKNDYRTSNYMSFAAPLKGKMSPPPPEAVAALRTFVFLHALKQGTTTTIDVGGLRGDWEGYARLVADLGVRVYASPPFRDRNTFTDAQGPPLLRPRRRRRSAGAQEAVDFVREVRWNSPGAPARAC
jgi:molybdenum cofactor synthesis domain-containing protein